jgi:hypothetical protein
VNLVEEKIFSITKLANQLSISRQTVYNKLDELESQLKPYIIMKNNVKYFKIEAMNIIKDSMRNQSKDSIKEESKDISTIEFLKNELSKKDEIYSSYISDLKQNNETLLQRIEHLEKESIEKSKLLEKESIEKNKLLENMQVESLEKNKLLENMQVLLKDQRLLIKENPKWWKFWKS